MAPTMVRGGKRLRRSCSLLALSLVLAIASNAIAGQDLEVTPTLDLECAAVRTAPQLFSGEVVGPQSLDALDGAPWNWNPAFGRVSREGVHYVSANYVQVRLVTDRCSQVSAVRFGSRLLTTTNSDGFRYFLQTTDPLPGFPGRMAHSISVFFPYGRDGATDTVSVTVSRPFRALSSVQYSFLLSRVSRVEAGNSGIFGRAPIGFSQAEVFNMFGRALYQQFNGAQNSTEIIRSDGEVVRIYGYDASQMHLTVDSRGVSFGFHFKIDKTCQPEAHVQGRFALATAFPAGVVMEWLVPPYANLQYSDGCEVLKGLPGIGEIVDLLFFNGAESEVAGGVQSRIEAAITSVLPDVSGATSAFLDGTATRTGELLVYLKLPAPSVLIQVPYDAFDMTRTAMAFPANSAVVLLASDLAPVDNVATGEPLPTLRSGPNGVPRFGTTTWLNALTLFRWGSLPWNDGVVARLLARRSDLQRTTMYRYAPACSIATDAQVPTPVFLRFGVNDTASDAARLRPTYNGQVLPHGYWVRVFFYDPGSRRCQSATTDLGTAPLATVNP